MTDQKHPTLILQPVPAPWERPRRSRAQRGPDGRLLSEGDRRWMKELAERQASVSAGEGTGDSAIDVDANASPDVPAQQ